jgi:hypothetical protein
MRIVLSFTVAFLCLPTWANHGNTKERPGPVSSATLPNGVRELTFDIGKCSRQKRGQCIAICTTREQVTQELGQEVGMAIWGQIDPKKEAVVVIGIADTCLDPALDKFIVREVKAEGTLTLRFRYDEGSGPHFLLGFEWPGRCKAYAVPRGAAVGLD